MQSINLRILVFLFAGFIYQSVFSQTFIGSGLIPESHREEWTKAGLLRDMSNVEPKRVFNVRDESGSDWDQIQAALNKAKSHSSQAGISIVYFPAGNYYFSDEIELGPADSNIVFQGAGSDKTFLIFNAVNKNSFQISGSEGSDKLLEPNTDIVKGTTTIIGDLALVNESDWVHFYDYAFWYEPPDPAKMENEIVGQITQIVTKNGNQATIKDQATRTYSAGNLRIRKVNPITNVGIEDLTIQRNSSSKATQEGKGMNINFADAVNCWVRGVQSYNPSRNHISFTRSSHIEVTGCYVHHAADYGGGGFGYGVTLYGSTTNSLVENNVFSHLRHSMVTGGGANCNVWTYNYSRDPIKEWLGFYIERDLDLHAKYPFGNLYEHNITVKIQADDHHGLNGPYNAFVRNAAYSFDGGSGDDGAYWGKIILKNAPETSVLGCELDNGIETSGTTSLEKNIYGHFNGGYQTHEYAMAYEPAARQSAAALPDASYYYSMRPDFLSAEYTWPTIGPKYSGSTVLTQSIPSVNRYFYEDKKTYLPNPTPKPMTSSGILTSSEIWNGSHTLTGDVTVPSGMSLWIEAGAVINVPSGKKIIIEGTLKAQGVPGFNITFQASSSSWWGIKFEDSSDDDECILEYCTIQDASYGVFCSHASPDIKNCTIQDNLYGIYGYYTNFKQEIQNNEVKENTYYCILLSHSSPTIETNDIQNDIQSEKNAIGIRADYSFGKIYDNTIKNLHSHGIYLRQSGPVLCDNEISANDGIGVFCSNNTTARFQRESDGYRGNNVIDNNGQNGVKIDSNSSPDLSSDDPYHPAENSLYMNVTKEVYSESSYEIIATYNWWGQDPPLSTQFVGDVDYTHPLHNDPNQSPPNLAKSSAQENSEAESNITYPGPKDALDHFEKGRSLERAGKYSEAITEYEYVVDTYPETKVSVSALVRLPRCYEKSGKSEDGNTYYKNVAKDNATLETGGKAMELQASDDTENEQYDDALSLYTSIIDNFAETEMSKQALFEKWQIYFNLTKDNQAAKKTMEEYTNDYPDDEWTTFMKVATGDIKFENAPKLKRPGADNFSQPDTTVITNHPPEAFSVIGNYPNPFNPETKIRFILPAEGRVTLEVFDIRGREVAMPIDAERPAGVCTVTWNGKDRLGRNAASGMYFYRIRFKDRVLTNKMILMR